MKVLCKQLVDVLGERQTESAWLTVGKSYHVLSVTLDSHGRWLLRLVGDSRPGVGLFGIEQFEVVSSRIPESWIAVWTDKGVFELTTEAWSEVGYWERFFDGEPHAVAAFERDATAIVLGEP